MVHILSEVVVSTMLKRQNIYIVRQVLMAVVVFLQCVLGWDVVPTICSV